MTFTVEIDASELDSTIKVLKKRLTPAQVNRVMGTVLRDTAEHTKEILKTAVPARYYVTPGEVGKAVGRAKVTSDGLGVGCCIPVTGARKSIGGGFYATGGARGWESLHRRYKVKARIVKGRQSTLPQQMSTYGGQPPFRNLGSKQWGRGTNKGYFAPDGAYVFGRAPGASLGKQVYTRRAKGRLPVRGVVGIAVPQMVANRARGDVERGIKAQLEKSTAVKLEALIRGEG